MSDQSPYQPPQETGVRDSSNKTESVRRVARYQRWVIFALLFNIGTNILTLATNLGQLPIPGVLIIVLTLAAAVFAMVSIFLLTKELGSAVMGVICAILMIAPCISLLVLLIVNQKATSFLQSNGVHVGFLGTNPDNI